MWPSAILPVFYSTAAYGSKYVNNVKAEWWNYFTLLEQFTRIDGPRWWSFLSRLSEGTGRCWSNSSCCVGKIYNRHRWLSHNTIRHTHEQTHTWQKMRFAHANSSKLSNTIMCNHHLRRIIWMNTHAHAHKVHIKLETRLNVTSNLL